MQLCGVVMDKSVPQRSVAAFFIHSFYVKVEYFLKFCFML